MAQPQVRSTHSHSPYRPNVGNSIKGTVCAILAAGILGALVMLIAWFILGKTSLPAFSSSSILLALSTAASVIVLVTVGIMLYFWIRPPQAHWVRSSKAYVALTYLLSYITPACIIIAVLGLPLSVTDLYLDGINIDQVFRTQYLTRMTAEPGFSDMAYMDTPSFYPGLWFLGGGLFAKVFGLAGWAAFQPWALLTLAATSSMLVPVWHRITRSLPLAVTIAIITTAVMLAMGSEEPYASIVAMGIPAALILGWRGLQTSRWALIGTALFLGVSANIYTLYTGVTALAIVVMAIVLLFKTRWAPLWQLMTMGIIALIMAAVGWGQYLYALFTQPHGMVGMAQRYLPQAGTEVAFPFLQLNVVGILALLGLIILVMQAKKRDNPALIIGLIVFYAWVILSMIATLRTTTLLGFRMELPITLIMVTAGLFALGSFMTDRLPSLYPVNTSPGVARGLTNTLCIVLAALSISYIALTPQTLQHQLDLAYTDTDGNGVRADRFDPDSTSYFSDIDQYIVEQTGTQTGNIVLTDEMNFMAYYPYHAYQAITEHYANPLGEFQNRNEEIEHWMELNSPADLNASMTRAEQAYGWQAPNVFILRGSAQDVNTRGQWQYKIAESIFPNDPNVRFTTLMFNAAAFSEGWTLKDFGPYVVAVRAPHGAS